jgi:MinD-like ATPase involved in chromosome partitioning or flagellar assembly
LALADECAREGLSTALVDADRYAPSLDQLLGMAAVPASVTWAQRQAAQGMLTRLALLDAMPMTRTGVRLLPGAAGGSMLRPHLWPQVLRELRSAVQVVVVDLGAQPCADWVTGDDLYVDAAFECDELVTVGTCDPVGLARLMRFLECVKATATHFQATGPKHTVTVTHVPAGNHVATAFLRTHVASCVESLGGNLALVDDDPQTCLKSRTKGQTLAECAPTSQIRRDLRALASHICGRAA